MKIIAEFRECPDCKVDARLMHLIISEEISKGNMGDNTLACTAVKVVTNIDPRKPPISGARIPSARIFYDMCTKCGKEYTVRIEQGHVAIPLRPTDPVVFA